jgi:hypothetical protein
MNSAGGNPFVAQPQYANGGGQPMSDLERMIDTNARAFSSKNPHVPIDKVRQALQHSKGLFDTTFSTALKILLSTATGQQPALSAGSSPAFSPQNSTSSLPGQAPGQAQAYQPSMRYPGQNTAPQQSPPYPGSAAYQNMSQSQGGQQPGASPLNPNVPLHPHQMAGPGGPAANLNGLTAANLGGVSSFNGQMLAGPPPPVLPGTHPAIGFSALQILPQEQHQQFLQLAPNQQTDYSMQVYQALSQEQQKQYAAVAQNQQRVRDAWNRQQQASSSMMMIPPGSRPGAPGASANPYIGYASHNPTQQQQAMQQRFPGQNPVFRVGAPQAGAGAASSQQPSQAEIARQQHYLQEQHRILVAQLSPAERQQVLALPVAQQQQWVMLQVNQRMEHQKRQAAQHHRTQQQQMMAQKHQEHKQKMSGAAAAPIAAPVTKKRRRRGHSDSDEEELNLNDDSSGDDNDDDDEMDAGDGSEAEAERESKAIEWFNTTSTTELMEMTGERPEPSRNEYD